MSSYRRSQPSQDWTCRVCTLQNSRYSEHCFGCGYTNPNYSAENTTSNSQLRQRNRGTNYERNDGVRNPDPIRTERLIENEYPPNRRNHQSS